MDSVTWPPPVRMQRGKNAGTQLTLSCFVVQDPRPWDDGSAYIQDESSLPQLVHSRNYLTNVLRGLSPR